MTEGPSNPGTLKPGEAVALEPVLAVVPGSIVSRILIKQSAGNVTLFSFDVGQALSEHTAPFDALAYVLSGRAEIAVGGKATVVQTGEAVFMPAHVPHALKALEALKMLLVMIKNP